VLPEVIDELLNGSHIDVDTLEKVTQLQNGINTIEMSQTMKELVINDNLLNNYPKFSQQENMAKVKFHISNGNINEDEEWVDLLKEKNSQLYNSEFPDFTFNAEKQVAVNVNPEMSVSEGRVSPTQQENRPEITIDLQEEAKKKYTQIMEDKGWVERRFIAEDTSRRKFFENETFQKWYDVYFKVKETSKLPFTNDPKALVTLDENGASKEKIFNYGKGGIGVTYPQIDNLTDEVLHLSALKVRADGIENPYVFVKKPQSQAELAIRERFVEKQVEALMEHGSYSIDDIQVAPYMKHVIDKIKQKKEGFGIENIDNLQKKAIEGELNTLEKQSLTGFIVGYEEFSTKEELLLKEKIDNDKPLDEVYANMLSKKIDESKKFSVKYDASKDDNSNISTNDIEKEEDLTSTLSGFPEADEQNLLENKGKALKEFRDFADEKGNPENKNEFGLQNPEAVAIMKIKRKMDNNIEINGISEELEDLINRKSVLIDLYKTSQFPHQMLSQIPMLLNDKKAINKSWEEFNPMAQEEVRQIAGTHEGLTNLLISAGCDVNSYQGQSNSNVQDSSVQDNIQQQNHDNSFGDYSNIQTSNEDNAYNEYNQYSQHNGDNNHEDLTTSYSQTVVDPKGIELSEDKAIEEPKGVEKEPTIKPSKRKKGRTNKV
jgi:hypothetical protein